MTTATRFEHRTAILRVEEKTFGFTRADVLQGLTQESTRLITSLGEEGWELVSVVRYGDLGETQALIAFFKRRLE